MAFEDLETITKGDLESLIGTAPERKRREYKRELPGGGDSRKEFVADLSAFANSEGGDIFFGISEDRQSHTPASIQGVAVNDAESQIAVLENVLRDSVRPRLPRLAFHIVRLYNDRGVLVIRVGESYLKPHQSMLDHRFYARNTNGKYILEVSELADIVSRRESLPTRMRQFRRDRVSMIRTLPEDMPSPIDAESKLVVHYMPEQSFGRFDVVDVGRLADPAFRNKIRAVPVNNVNGLSYRPNIDGFMYMNGRSDTEFKWYTQIFCDGTVEFVNGITFMNRISKGREFHPNWVEQDLFCSFLFVQQVYETLGIQGRVSIFASAVGIRDHTITLGEGRLSLALAFTGHSSTIGRDPALFNEVTVDSMQEDEKLSLRPIADQLSRAAGLSHALSYENGQYVGYRD